MISLKIMLGNEILLRKNIVQTLGPGYIKSAFWITIWMSKVFRKIKYCSSGSIKHTVINESENRKQLLYIQWRRNAAKGFGINRTALNFKD